MDEADFDLAEAWREQTLPDAVRQRLDWLWTRSFPSGTEPQFVYSVRLDDEGGLLVLLDGRPYIVTVTEEEGRLTIPGSLEGGFLTETVRPREHGYSVEMRYEHDALRGRELTATRFAIPHSQALQNPGLASRARRGEELRDVLRGWAGALPHRDPPTTAV